MPHASPFLAKPCHPEPPIPGLRLLIRLSSVAEVKVLPCASLAFQRAPEDTVVFHYFLHHVAVAWPENILNNIQMEPAVTKLRETLKPYGVTFTDQMEEEIKLWLSGDRIKDVDKAKSAGKYKPGQAILLHKAPRAPEESKDATESKEPRGLLCQASASI